MSEISRPPTFSSALRYQHPRAIFICGFALATFLWFIPTISVVTEWRTESLSNFQLARFLIESRQFGLCFLVAVPCLISFAITVLAVRYPRRWVFILGSFYALCAIAHGAFIGATAAMEFVDVYFAPKILTYVASVMGLIGFIIRPPIVGTPNHE